MDAIQPLDDRIWHLWALKSPPRQGTIVIRREGDLSDTLVRREDLGPSFNIAGLWWTEAPTFTLEERVEGLEKALNAQDTVHKMDLRAIAAALRAVLAVGSDQYPSEYSRIQAEHEIGKVERE